MRITVAIFFALPGASIAIMRGDKVIFAGRGTDDRFSSSVLRAWDKGAMAVVQRSPEDRQVTANQLLMTWPLAHGHDAAGNGKCTVIRPAADNSATWPSGSIFSNTADLSRFLSKTQRHKFIRIPFAPETESSVFHSDFRLPTPEFLFIDTLRGVHILEHGGTRAGYGPLQPKEEPKSKTALPVTAGDVNRNTGVYKNGDQQIEIVAKGSIAGPDPLPA